MPAQNCMLFSLLWKMLCAMPRKMSGFRAISINLKRRSSLRKEFTSHTVSTVEDVLEPPSRCLSSISVLFLSKAMCHTHNSTVTLHKLRTSSPLGYLNSHFATKLTPKNLNTLSISILDHVPSKPSVMK